MALMNWDNPPELDAPKRRQVRGQFADRMKLVRLQQVRAKGRKNHSTNREGSFLDRTKAKILALRHEEYLKARRAYTAAVRAYWLGQTEQHPEN